MAELSSKDKQALALLYEYPEYKSFQKWSELKRLTMAAQILKVDMSTPGSAERIAFLQGQAYAHEFSLLELKNIHKVNTKEP